MLRSNLTCMKSLRATKLLFVIGCLIASSAPAAASAATTLNPNAAPIPCLAPAAGLVSWWTGDDHGSDIVNGMDATLFNGAGYTAGRVGAAMHFDGISTYATATAHPDLAGLPEFSLELWFRPSRDINQGEARVFPVFTNGPDYTLDISNADSQLELRGPVPRPASGSRSWLGGTWYHLAIVYTNPGGYVMYIDGVPVSTSPDTISLFSGATTLGLAWEPGTLSVPPTPGDLDEITIYRRAISSADIASIYQAGIAGVGKCKYRMPFSGSFPIAKGPYCPGQRGHLGPRQHEAIDYAMKHHPVLASQAGTVEHVGASVDQLGLGWYVRILHADGHRSVYAHLKDPESILVSVGDRVVWGQPIGISGRSSFTRPVGFHLHFHIYDERLPGNSKASPIPRTIPTTTWVGSPTNICAYEIVNGRRVFGTAEGPY